MTWAEQEMMDGFLDGLSADSPKPSSNRSLSYRWGFTNALRDRGLHARFKSAERARRIAVYILRRDNRMPGTLQ